MGRDFVAPEQWNYLSPEWRQRMLKNFCTGNDEKPWVLKKFNTDQLLLILGLGAIILALTVYRFFWVVP